MEAKSTPKPVGRVVVISVDDILPNPEQPRESFSEPEMAGLAESIRHVGIIQPLSVRRLRNGEYELIAGERRLRAAKDVGLREVPCIEVSTNDGGCAIMTLLENMQRQNLNFFEEARGIMRLLRDYAITQERAAGYLGISQSALSNKLRLLALPKDIQDEISKNGLTERHARAFLKLQTQQDMAVIIGEVVKKKLNVAATEMLIYQYLQGQKPENRQRPVIKDIKIFMNTISHAVKVMREAGIMADSIKRETEDYIEYFVKIPKSKP